MIFAVYTEGVTFKLKNKNIFNKLKINTLYNITNFPKVLNFWKVISLFALFVFLQTAVFGQRVDTNPKAYATLDTNSMLIGDKGKLRLSVELESG